MAYKVIAYVVMGGHVVDVQRVLVCEIPKHGLYSHRLCSYGRPRRQRSASACLWNPVA